MRIASEPGRLTETISGDPSLDHESKIALPAKGLRTPLPGRSHSLFALNRVLNSSPIDLREAAEVVRADLGLTAQVLRLAYSDLAADEEPGPTLDRCLVLLGVRTLRAQVLTAPLLESAIAPAYVADAGALWDHSLLTARIAQRLAQASAYFDPERAYLAALLHDVGMLLSLLRTESGLPALLNREGDDRTISTHCLLGSRWAATWRLPSFFIDVIENHHHVERARHDPALLTTVAAANSIAHLWGFGVTLDSAGALDRDPLLKICARFLPQLSPAQIAPLIEQFARDYAAWVEPLSISAPIPLASRDAALKEEFK